MRFSVFTPTHKPDYLMEAYASLCAQAFTDWEWVVVPNGQAVIPEPIASDARVRVIPAPDWVARLGVGPLKRFACESCAGDYLVELDHDDLLTPEALGAISQAIDETGAQFLYSDFANFRADGTCEVYGAAHGWESYPYVLNGTTYTAMRAFAPDASSLHLIFFAPNHVRVWSREAYQRSGGHDPSLAVADDHDLVCRTYITGARFHHIPRCLYLYRLLPDGGNTYVQRNAEIQTTQQEVSNRYMYELIASWAARMSLPMLDLGGATGSPKGYRSVDLRDADVICDIRQGLPFPDDSVACVRAYDFLEHIPTCRDSTCNHGADGRSPKCAIGLMNEIYRVLAPGGWLVSRTPSTDGRGAFQDPTHVSFWNPNSFWYYTRREQARYVPGIRCRFQRTRLWQSFPSEWERTNNIPYVFADLVALKGQRQPGICEI